MSTAGGVAATAPGVALRTKLALAAPSVRSAAAALWSAPDPRRRYLDYLRVMHGLVRASVPLLERAAQRCTALAAAGDPVADPLLRYLTGHAEEERHHDDWLLADLAAAGADAAAAAAGLPPVGVAELAGAQYYWIEHHHPVVLLGYVAVLEAHAPAPGLARRLARTTGLPAPAFRTLVEHADLDTGHTDALYRTLDRLPLTTGQQTAVAVSALRTAHGVTRIFRALAAPGGTRDRQP